MVKRKISRKMREINKAVSISAFWSFVLSLGGLIISFLVAFPNSSIKEGDIINPYFVMNIFLVIITITVILYISYLLIWLYVKNAPPLVEIKEHFWQDSAYIRIRNNEPVDIIYIQIKMGGLAIGNHPNAIGILGHNNLIKIEKRIVSGEKIDIPIAIGKNGFTRFSVDDGLYNLSLDNLKEKETRKKYGIALEVLVRPVDEEKSMLVGWYFGTIHHTRLNGKELSDGVRVFPDKLVYQDLVNWEKDSFKQMTEKEYLDFTKVNIPFQ